MRLFILSFVPLPSPFRKPFPQPPILRFQLGDELDKLPSLVPQEYQLLNIFGSDERLNLVNVVPGPLRQFVDSRWQPFRLHNENYARGK
jgi:hypothetical protein